MNHLIPFAGHVGAPRKKSAPTAYTLFQLGHDTVEIAELLGVKEHVASRMLHEQRCRAKGLPCEMERPA